MIHVQISDVEEPNARYAKHCIAWHLDDKDFKEDWKKALEIVRTKTGPYGYDHTAPLKEMETMGWKMIPYHPIKVEF